ASGPSPRPRAVPTATGRPSAAANAVHAAGGSPTCPCRTMPAATSRLQVTKGPTASLDPDQVPDGVELRGTDAGHFHDVLDNGEGPPCLPVLHDAPGQGGPDAGQALQFRRLAPVDVDAEVHRRRRDRRRRGRARTVRLAR